MKRRHFIESKCSRCSRTAVALNTLQQKFLQKLKKEEFRMKKRLLFLTSFAIVTLLTSAVNSGLPVPPAVTYGLIRDEYGQPLLSGAGVWLVKAAEPEKICAGHTINGLLRADVNYRLSLELESVAPLDRSYAALIGTPMRIIVKVGETEQPLTPSPLFDAPAAGTARRVDFFTGVDADDDGLPDAWEWLIIAWSEGLYNALSDIDPNGDIDNDGMTNRQEFLAGTNPLLSTDLLMVTRFERVADASRMAITFTTVENRRYHILTAATGVADQWSPVPTAAAREVAPAYQTYLGTGRDITVYVEMLAPAALFRIAVN